MLPRLGPVPGLTPGRLDHEDVAVCWQANARAPISTHSDSDCAGIVFGDAIPRSASSRLSAAGLVQRWADDAFEQACDGFFAGISIRGAEILVGVDVLGLFPLYYAESGDVLLVGSSYNIFAQHPLFAHQEDLEGLLGHLLIAGPLNGRTLSRGVRRLPPGMRLRWRGGRGTSEDMIYALPRESDVESTDRGGAAAQMGAALESAVRRHTAPHPAVSLLLSGGRDSRLLAGYLSRCGRSAHAVSLGRPADFDVAFAARVAAQLNLPHQVYDIPFSEFRALADLSVQWEQLSAGMGSVHSWGNGAALGDTPAVLAGYLMELRQIDLGGMSRDDVLRRTHGHGLPPDILASVLRTDHAKTAMWELHAQMCDRYDGMARSLSDRKWPWLVSTYGRFHAGSVPWRISFSAWPILPILDQELLATIFSLHEPWLADRKLQEALLRNEFPALARLPLDRNSHDTRPLIESRMSRWTRSVRQRAAARRLSSVHSGADTVERRYYWRMYDFDNAGWQEIRRAAESGRDALGDLFDLRALAAIVPAPDVTCAHSDPVGQGYAPKLLTGLMRWHVLRARAQ